MVSHSTLKRSLAGALLAAGVVTHALPVVAEDVPCTCATSGTDVLATLTEVSGQVLVSTPSGFLPAEAGVSLTQDSRVLSGPDAAATVTMGASCSVTMAASSRLSVEEVDGAMCLKTIAVLQEETTVRVSTQATGTEAVVAGVALEANPVALPLLIGTGVVGIGLAVGSGGSSSP